MTESIICAIITGGLALLGVIIANNSTQKLTAYKIDELKNDTGDKLSALKESTEIKLESLRKDVDTLSTRVDKHNNVIERVAIVEQSTKSAHHRLDDMGAGRVAGN